MLAGLMPQGSVLPLDLIGIEGARVFRKNMLRYDDPFRKNKKVAILGVFLFFLAPGSASCWCHGRGGLGAAPLLMTLGSVVGGAGSAARCGDAPGGATWAAGLPWTTRRREWSGPGVTPLVALETLRVGAWSGAAGRHKKCLRLLASVREGKSICWAAYWRFASPRSRAFSLAASAGALALIPSQRQLHCGIMIRTVSKEL